MKWVNHFSVIAISLGSLLAGTAMARNPIGETASYSIDKGNNRTSGIISKGQLIFSIPRMLESADPANPSFFESRIDFDVQASILGHQKGKQSIKTPAAFFTPEFWEKLRVTKFYDAGDFKIKHEGMVASTKTMSGIVYENLDQIFIYDVKPMANNAFAAFARALIQANYPQLFTDNSKLQALENIQVRALRHESIPALEAAKADLTAKYSGISIKAGGDYIAP